jgi:hypothetical protein
MKKMKKMRRCHGRNRDVQEFAAEGCLRRGYRFLLAFSSL